MKIDKNIQRFESELKKINRPGMDKLLAYAIFTPLRPAPGVWR